MSLINRTNECIELTFQPDSAILCDVDSDSSLRGGVPWIILHTNNHATEVWMDLTLDEATRLRARLDLCIDSIRPKVGVK